MNYSCTVPFLESDRCIFLVSIDFDDFVPGDKPAPTNPGHMFKTLRPDKNVPRLIQMEEPADHSHR